MFQLCLQLMGLQILCCLIHCNPTLVLAGKVVSKYADLMAEQCVCSSGSELLLLLRNSKHNNNTWGLPGGNVEDDDTDLLVTAKREAQEEMGSVPEATFENQVLTK